MGIVEPGPGAALEGSEVRVVLEAQGIEIAPASDQRAGTAHHHLFIDREPTPRTDTIPSGVSGIIHLGRGQTEFTIRDLAPGEHTVIAVLADPWHVPIEGAAEDTVRFRVRPAAEAPEPAAEAPEPAAGEAPQPAAGEAPQPAAGGQNR